MKMMYNKRILADFIIVSNDGTKFPCHRAVMATRSDVMMAMMEADMREKKDSTLNLQFNGEIIKAFVDFFYDEELDKELIAREIGSFLDLSEAYNLTSLKLLTENVALGRLKCENMLEMYFLADKYKAKELKAAAELFIRSNKKYLDSQDLQETLRGADKEQALEIIRILSRE